MVCKNKESMKIFKFLCVIFLNIFLFISCQTTKVPDIFLEEARFAPLDNGASAYFFADVKRARPIIELLPIEELKDRQTAQMLDRTNYIAAAIFPAESKRNFQIAAWGNYPSSMAGIAFRNWESLISQTGQPYWYSDINKLSIALSSNQAFIASSFTDEPFDPLTLAPGVAIPQGFNAFRQGTPGLPEAPISCWFENPSQMITDLLNQGGIPLQLLAKQLFINLYCITDNQYEALIRLVFENVSFARGMAAILNLAGGNISDNAVINLILSNPPVQNNNYIDIKTPILSDNDLINLFDIFSFY